MAKVKSFEIEIEAEKEKQNVISVSDTALTDDKGRTVGLVRVVCYED